MSDLPDSEDCSLFGKKKTEDGGSCVRGKGTSTSDSYGEGAGGSASFGESLARGLKDGTVVKNISADTQKVWDRSNENSKPYETQKDKDFQMMLQILSKYGGAEMSRLATETVDDGMETVPLLIDVLRKVKDRRFFLIILDECLKFLWNSQRSRTGRSIPVAPCN